jgi:endonuclease I
MTLDAHNMMVIPSRLNSHRQAYRFCASPTPETDWQNLDDLGWLCNSTFPRAHKNTRRGLFVPPEEWRGPVARKVCYMIVVYPALMSLIFSRVLCPRLIREWNARYPVLDDERTAEEVVARVQRNRNPFVLDPASVNRTLHHSQCQASDCVCAFSHRGSLRDGKDGTRPFDGSHDETVDSDP